jgi:hypothetical protein
VADVTITALSNDEAPTDYAVPPAQEIVIKLASALFDGTGASGDFVPVLEVISPDLRVVGSFPIGNAVPAGSSLFVSWFPRGGVATSAPSTPGIQFDIDNEGGYLEIGTNDTVPGFGSASQVFKNSGNDNVGKLIQVTAEQQNAGTNGIVGMEIDAIGDDGSALHSAHALILQAEQDSGGLATALSARTFGGSSNTGIDIAVAADSGGHKTGLVTNAPIAFNADEGPVALPAVLAQLYLKSAGGGTHSLIARAGTTEVTLVTG